MTVDVLITDAFREIGLPRDGKTLTYQDRAFALRKANSILDALNVQPLMAFNDDAFSLVLTAGKESLIADN